MFTDGVLSYIKDKINYLEEDEPKLVELAGNIRAFFAKKIST